MSVRQSILPWAAVLLVGGCGGGLATHPVRGKVELAGGKPAALAGAYVEAVLQSDPSRKCSGAVGEDGTFTLQTQHEGAILRGAPAGVYRVRLILADDDKKVARQQAAAVARRYLAVETSGLTLTVPAAGEVKLEVSPR